MALIRFIHDAAHKIKDIKHNTMYLKRLDLPFLCNFLSWTVVYDFQYFNTFSSDKNRKQFNIGINSHFRSIFFRFDTYLHPSKSLISSMNSICERLHYFQKTLVMHMNSPVTFVSTCDNDATHLTCHF